MHQLMTFYCQLFGYTTCSDMSMIEALALFGILVIAAKFIDVILAGLIFGRR